MSIDLADFLDLDQTWRWSAACRGYPFSVFFGPDENWHTSKQERQAAVRQAKAVCAGCPVRKECLEYALTHSERQGVWGGKSARERLRMRVRSAA